jgi:solute carrier family 25 (mitochondrial S-adenosylmethionine transporter), member 26
MSDPPPVSFLTALVAGGMAGTSVDVALFPIDTIKTRLQSPKGFLAAGGFRGIYQGLGAAAAGSAPGAALFFSVYEVRSVLELTQS